MRMSGYRAIASWQVLFEVMEMSFVVGQDRQFALGAARLPRLAARCGLADELRYGPVILKNEDFLTRSEFSNQLRQVSVASCNVTFEDMGVSPSLQAIEPWVIEPRITRITPIEIRIIRAIRVIRGSTAFTARFSSTPVLRS